jgi:hypothetical protein
MCVWNNSNLMITIFIMNKIHLNRFSLEIISDNNVRKVTQNGSTYFALPNESEYKLKLGSNLDTITDAYVWIDDELAGIWRIESFATITIERPSNVKRKFTFLKEGSNAARKAGIIKGNELNGLIKVTFKPKKQYHIAQFTTFSNSSPMEKYSMKSCCQTSSFGDTYQSFNDSISAGATALGDKSSQKFSSTSGISEYDVDTDNVTTINARLVIDDDFSQKYVSLRKNRENNVPAPLTPSYWSRIFD